MTRHQPTAAPASGAGRAAEGTIAYRPDIDGLRTVAVLSVVLFHAGVSGLPGGFTGVDIFFVISGFLIGGHIFREIAVGRFSFVDFYARRVRRILPALFAMLAIFYAIGLVLLTPLELRELGKEGVATVFGLSNILYYSGGGYFAPTAEHDPLLMTWSLGVEEQFYLLFPPLMLLVARIRRVPPMLVLIGLSLLSFAGSLALIRIDPTGAFYLLPTRAWELGIGAALALWSGSPAATGRHGPIEEGAAVLGAVLLIAGIGFYAATTPFPGVFVLFPTIGALLLLATPGSAINRLLLASPPAVFIGKISYSLYLWHWPIFYLDRQIAASGGGMPAWVLVGLALVLAIASWRLVEQPLRRRRLPDRTALMRYAVVALVMAAPAAGFFARAGLPGRLPELGRRFAIDAEQARRDPCLAPYGADTPRDLPRCMPPLADGRRDRLVVLGDSHAGAIAPGFATIAARSPGTGFGEMAKASCLPLLGYARDLPDRAGHRGQCLAYMDRAFAIVQADPRDRIVVLAGYWAAAPQVQDRTGRWRPLAAALDETITRLERMGRQVVLVQDVPTFDFDPYARMLGDAMPARAALGRLLGGTPGVTVGAWASVAPDGARAAITAVAARHPTLRLLDPRAALCDRAGCRFGTRDRLFYFDFQHLTAPGAEAAVAGLAP